MPLSKSYILIAIYCLPLCAGNESRIPKLPKIPKTFRLEVSLKSDPTPIDINIDTHIPDLAHVAEAITNASHATENASRHIATLPQSAGICALIALGGVCATMFVYYGIKKLDGSKEMGACLIGTGLATFIGLYFAATSPRFTSLL